MSASFDAIVIGGGPAGIGAALAASHRGLSVVLLDEQCEAGGQVYRAKPAEFAAHANSRSSDHSDGDALRSELAASNVVARFDRRVWLVTPGFNVKTLAGETIESYDAPRLIVATGASERIIPVPGWTLPGVVGLAGATILLKSQRMLPGRRCVVAGAGPLLAAVAVGILEGGGEVAAIVDLATRGEWLAALPAMTARPDLLKRGAAWFLKLAASHVPILHGHHVVRVEGRDAVERVVVAPVDGDGRRVAGAERVVNADALAIGHGLVPSTDITRLLRAEHDYDERAGGWIARSDGCGRSTIDGLYVAGETSGIAGAAAALERGRVAGLALAADAGRGDAAALESAQDAAARAERFGGAMAALMRARPGLAAEIPSDCVVCRCEDVERREIDEALQAGARDVNQLKSWTRCGMGPCQGRICGETAAMLVAQRFGSREAAGQFTGRPPLRPVPSRALIGEYDYADLKLPPPAPS
jgi:thioredoxin reductase/bacterioferritin-associated ferredoxin